MDAEVEVLSCTFEHERIVSKAGAGPDLETTDEAVVLLDGVVNKLKGAGLSARASLRHAAPREVAREIIAVADEPGPDFIVVGSCGLSGISETLLGSVSHELVQHARRPVVVTHERHPAAARTSP